MQSAALYFLLTFEDAFVVPILEQCFRAMYIIIISHFRTPSALFIGPTKQYNACPLDSALILALLAYWPST